MAKQLLAYCPKCDRNVPVKKPATAPFLIHLIGVIMTGGLWLIVWLMMSLDRPSAKCPRCKGKIKCS